LWFRVRDRTLKRVRYEGRRSKFARPDRGTFQSWRVPFIVVSGSGPSPQEGALLRPAVQIRPPRQRDLPILEGPFLLRFRLRDRALKRVRCEGRRSKSARPDRRTFRSWRVLFLLGFGFGAEPSRGCFAKVGGPNPPARKSEPRLSFLPYPRFQGF